MGQKHNIKVSAERSEERCTTSLFFSSCLELKGMGSSPPLVGYLKRPHREDTFHEEAMAKYEEASYFLVLPLEVLMVEGRVSLAYQNAPINFGMGSRE